MIEALQEPDDPELVEIGLNCSTLTDKSAQEILLMTNKNSVAVQTPIEFLLLGQMQLTGTSSSSISSAPSSAFSPFLRHNQSTRQIPRRNNRTDTKEQSRPLSVPLDDSEGAIVRETVSIIRNTGNDLTKEFSSSFNVVNTASDWFFNKMSRAFSSALGLNYMAPVARQRPRSQAFPETSVRRSRLGHSSTYSCVEGVLMRKSSQAESGLALGPESPVLAHNTSDEEEEDDNCFFK
ncbi:hypothetical protein Ciccas_013108 [Cichlidogyrus casuarinus]|uniref:Uncharacterized protein n=1 Tax=Cichlidogyrus casuarinus TaxID=1844966 RepID=A0ABD2PRJ5_9PLAT